MLTEIKSNPTTEETLKANQQAVRQASKQNKQTYEAQQFDTNKLTWPGDAGLLSFQPVQVVVVVVGAGQQN